MRNKHTISLQEKAIFLRQFAMLLSAGIPIIQTCHLLASCQTKPALILLIHQLHYRLRAGHSLAHSFKQVAHQWDHFTHHLIALGEHTGQLDKLLLLAAEYDEKKHWWQTRLQKALLYPMFILIVTIMLLLLLIVLIIPQFETLFQTANVPLPLLTRIIFKSTDGCRLLFLPFCGTVLSGGLWMRYMTHHSLQSIALKLPLLHTLLSRILITRFTKQLSLALAANVPLLQALTLTASTKDSFLSPVISRMTQHLQSGATLHQALAKQSIFPALLVQMVKIGEEGGILEEMVNKFTDFMEKEIQHKLERFHLILEPFIMILLGVIIGGLVIGLYLPLFQLGKIF